MKTKSYRFFALGAVVVNLIAAPMVTSQTERFSASLAGANEVPPINSAGTGSLRNDDPGHYHLLANVLRSVIAPYCVSPAFRAQQGRRWCDDIPVRWRRPTSLPGGHFRNHYGDNHSSKCYGAHGQGITARRPRLRLGGRARAICPMRTCTRRISPGVRFAATFSGAGGT